MEAKKLKRRILLTGLLLAMLGSGQAFATNELASNNERTMQTVESLLINKTLRAGSHYDSRIYRYIQERSVGSTNESWAIAATRAVEYTSPYTIGYSERHLDYSTALNSTTSGTTPNAHYRNLGGGGNSEVALGYYTSGRGPVSNQVSAWAWQNNLNKVSLSSLQSQDVVNKVDEYTQFPSVYKYRQSGYTIAMDRDSTTMYTGGEVELNRDAIKEHILKHGSVIARIYKANQYFQYNYMTESSKDFYYDDSENGGSYYDHTEYYRHYYAVPGGLSYYCNLKDATPNHEIVIIGWDDDYTNAYTGAPRRGAYIALDADYFTRTWNNAYIKGNYYWWRSNNEWTANGTNVTTNQNVYYIPYDDYYVESNVYGIGKTSYVDYTSIYQHDPLGMSGTITGEYYNPEIYGANIFKRDKTYAQNLNEISVASKMPLKYEIYVNPRDGELSEEKLIKVATTDRLEAGYHTIKLDEGIILTGDKFAIAVKYIADSDSDKFAERTAKIGVETPIETYWEIRTDSSGRETAVKKTKAVQYWQNATSSPGQSYISNDMETWSDLYDKTETRNMNICIKAFVTDNPTYRVPAEKVIISKTELDIVKGDQEVLSARIDPDNAADKKVYWSTSNRAVAAVDQDGIVTAISGGTATITARSSNSTVYAECKVNVKVPVENIVLNQKEVTMLANETYILAPIISPEDATTREVQWSTSNKQVCLVTDDGVLIGLKQGRAIITALIKDEYGTHTATCTVVVPESLLVDVTEVRLNKSQMTLEKGTRENLTATVYPDDATNKSVVWTSSNKSVAIVNANGRVTALSPGTSRITVTTVNGGETATCDVTVTEVQTVGVTGVSLNKTKLNLTKGDSDTLTATVAPTNATNKKVKWISSDEDVAFVNDNGRVTGVGKGKATITVKTEDGLKVATCEVNVTLEDIRVTGVSLNTTGATLKQQDNLLLIADVLPYNASNKNITWSSDNNSVATVDQNGNVTAVGDGKATITVTTEDGNFKKTCVVNVITDVAVTGIELDETASVQVGRTIDLTAVVNPANATNKNVIWTSGDEETLLVVDGKVLGVKAGSTTVTAKTEDGGFEAVCTVTVEDSTAQIDLTSNEYLISNENVIYNISTETTVEDFVDGLQTEGKVQILDAEGNEVAETGTIGTGMTVQVTKVDGEGNPILNSETNQPITETYDVIIEGDITGDGKSSEEDLQVLVSILMNSVTLDDKYIPAIDLNGDGVVDIIDLAMMQDLLDSQAQANNQTED